jgi:hypothetical protein
MAVRETFLAFDVTAIVNEMLELGILNFDRR